MRRAAGDLTSLCTRQAEEAFGALLPATLLAAPPGSRSRIFTTPVVFRTFLCQILGSVSCRPAQSAAEPPHPCLRRHHHQHARYFRKPSVLASVRSGAGGSGLPGHAHRRTLRSGHRCMDRHGARHLRRQQAWQRKDALGQALEASSSRGHRLSPTPASATGSAWPCAESRDWVVGGRADWKASAASR